MRKHVKWMTNAGVSAWFMGIWFIALLGGCASPPIGRPEPAETAGPQRPTAQTAQLAADQTAPADSDEPEEMVAPRSAPALGLLDNFHEVAAGRAYRSAQVRPDTVQHIVNTYCVRTIINLRGENEFDEWYQLEKLACDSMGVRLINVRMSAYDLPDVQALSALYDAIKAAQEPVLFHCKSGADRTGMASAVWRMMMLGESNQTASQELSIAYGHFRSAMPAMDQLVEMFVPDRKWIRKQYPKLRAEAVKQAQADQSRRNRNE